MLLKYVGEPTLVIADEMDGPIVGQDHGAGARVDDGARGTLEITRIRLYELKFGFVLGQAITLREAEEQNSYDQRRRP
jgi:hypothetical protein